MMEASRIIDPRGYVLIRVGKDHHLADCRGLAYEHRLVAEKKIGRSLVKGEMVHHANGNPSDNRPENLEVVDGIAGHKLRHRGKDSKLRNPGEENPVIECACGCGAKLLKYDDAGRPRRFRFGCSYRKGTGKRHSTETITCACGCGEEINRYDRYGRERYYISGHNAKKKVEA